jgi:predicted DNA-binding transcriptional regulator AlpA
VSEQTGLSATTLKDLRSKPGQDPLPFYKIGRCVRYAEDDVVKWLERRSSSTRKKRDSVRAHDQGEEIRQPLPSEVDIQLGVP